MKSLSEEILSFWKEGDPGYARELSLLSGTNMPAWAINMADGSFGVAVPYGDGAQVSEAFANVWLQSACIKNISDGPALALLSFDIGQAFASLCAEFVSPGPEGTARKDLIANPVAWWREWKSLLGNKNVERRVYDVLGELVCLEALSCMGMNPVWGGPYGASADIDCGSKKYEVKSTLSRNAKTVQVHGLFQLAGAETTKYLVLAQFESAVEGLSINAMIERLVPLGFSRAELNNSLMDLGYPNGNSARDRCYELHELTCFEIDEYFPRISPESFIGGSLPAGVMSINYSISLDNVEGESLRKFLDASGDQEN